MTEARSPLTAPGGTPDRLAVPRGLAYAGLALAFFHVVAAAVVRVAGGPTGAAARLAFAGEASAWILGALLATMMVAVLRQRRAPGVAGASGVVGALALAAALLIGIVIAATGATPLADAGAAIARTLLVAALALLVLRAGGLGASDVEPGSGQARSAQTALAGVGVAFAAVALGALTARVPGAASACVGVLSCAAATADAGARHVHLAHQSLALLLVALTSAAAVGVFRRGEPAPVQRAARMALGSVLLQIGVAVALVMEALPASLRSLHAATGMLVWLSLVTYAALAHRAAVVRVPAGNAEGPIETPSIATRPRMAAAARRAYSTPVAVPAILATLAVEAMGAATEPAHPDTNDASGHGAPERAATRESADVPATAHAGETVRVAVTAGAVAAVVVGHEQPLPAQSVVVTVGELEPASDDITVAERETQPDDAPVTLAAALPDAAPAAIEVAAIEVAAIDVDDSADLEPAPAFIIRRIPPERPALAAATALVDAPTGVDDFLTRRYVADQPDDADGSLTIASDATPEVVAPAPPRARRRPPTLAVLIARGADF